MTYIGWEIPTDIYCVLILYHFYVYEKVINIIYSYFDCY